MDYPGAQKIRILFADADAAFCVFVRYSLEQLSFHVTVANDGADLVARFLPEDFDVVLVGLVTPFLDGIQVLRAIKQRSPTTPVILLCDADCATRGEEGMQEGAFLYFQKPLNDFAQLGDAITRAHETRRLHPPAAETSAEVGLSDVTLIHQLVEATRTQPLSVTLQTLSYAGARLIQAPYAILLLAHPDAGTQVFSTHGFENQEAAIRALATQVGDSFAARVIAERRTIIAPILPAPAESATPYAIGVPLLAENQTLGALIIYPLAHTEVNAECIAQLEMLAAQGVLAIEFARLRGENTRLIAIDPTTGVLKREPFLELADREFRRSWRYNQPITAIIVDIDDLTGINRKGGRAFGDQVLRAVANVCANVIRSIDLIGRFDSDAFALLLVMTESESTKSVAERLRIEINAIQLANAPSLAQITATLGVCSYPRNACTSIFDLLAVTEEAQRGARYRGANEIIYG